MLRILLILVLLVLPASAHHLAQPLGYRPANNGRTQGDYRISRGSFRIGNRTVQEKVWRVRNQNNNDDLFIVALPKQESWNAATQACENLRVNRHGGWKLPTTAEQMFFIGYEVLPISIRTGNQGGKPVLNYVMWARLSTDRANRTHLRDTDNVIVFRSSQRGTRPRPLDLSQAVEDYTKQMKDLLKLRQTPARRNEIEILNVLIEKFEDGLPVYCVKGQLG